MKRILLKLSGEALANNSGKFYDVDFVDRVAEVIKTAADEGYQIAVVVGAGNIWRGREGEGMDRTAADRMGMLATVMNSIYLKEALLRAGAKAQVMTATPMLPFAEGYTAERAVKALEAGEVVVFGAGLGIPFISTDTAGAVRAAEIGADAMLMAKNVSYIYSDDPRKNPDAEKFTEVDASKVLALNLKAIDATATAFCMSCGMQIKVFGFTDPESILKAIRGEALGTVISPK